MFDIIHECADCFNTLFKRRFLTDAVPGLNGEIQVAVYTHDEWPSSYLELTTYNDFSLNLTRYDYFEGKWEIKEDLFLGSIEEVKSSITDYGREIHPWRVTSEYYPKDTYYKRLGRFSSEAFKNYKGNISVVQELCISNGRDKVCNHLAKYYLSVDEPPHIFGHLMTKLYQVRLVLCNQIARVVINAIMQLKI